MERIWTLLGQQARRRHCQKSQLHRPHCCHPQQESSKATFDEFGWDPRQT